MSNASSLHMTQLAGKKTTFKNLSKSIELKFISTAWRQLLTPKNKVTHKQISTCPKSYLITLKFSSLFIMKSFFNVSFCSWLIALISHFVRLGKTSNSWYKYSGPFLIRKNSSVCTEFPMCSKLNFSQLKTYFSQFFDKFLN